MQPLLLDEYEAVVVGSGFGGTIVALTLANKFEAAGGSSRVCLLERGQWWVSGEMPADTAWTTDGRPTLRGYLEERGAPFGTYAYPNDLAGFVQLARTSRTLDPVRGLYDLRTMGNVTTICGSGVGGGSLVYFNLTARPDPAAFRGWATQFGGKPLESYFEIAESFLGVNKITTTTALGRFKLGKSKVFQEAALEVDATSKDLMNPRELDADVSITDVPLGTFEQDREAQAGRAGLAWQTNICERHGRCGLGCVVEARHTMSERLFEAMEAGKPLDVFPLCPVDSVERDAAGRGYVVNVDDLRVDPKGVNRKVRATTVVLAAGTLGSTGILMSSKSLPKSRALGTRFSTNGDMFGIVSPTREVVEPGKGPLLTSLARYMDKRTGAHKFSLEDLGVPDMFAEVLSPLLDAMAAEKEVDSVLPKTNLLELFNRHVARRLEPRQRAGNEVLREIEGFGERASLLLTDAVGRVRAGLREVKGAAEGDPPELLRNVLVLFGMARDEQSGRLVEDGNGGVTLERPYDFDQGVYGDLVERMRLFAAKMSTEGESSLTIPFWDEVAKLELTAHPLGGCPMGKDALAGVVDGLGRVYSSEAGTAVHEGLLVADGAIVPTSLGVNPSLTICALAFRIAEEMTGDKRFWPMPWRGR